MDKELVTNVPAPWAAPRERRPLPARHLRDDVYRCPNCDQDIRTKVTIEALDK